MTASVIPVAAVALTLSIVGTLEWSARSNVTVLGFWFGETVSCSNCGAPVDLATGAACLHCGSALSMLDLQHADSVVRQLREAGTDKPVDASLPLDLARARAEVEAAFRAVTREREWYIDVAATGLIGAGLRVVARWLQPGS
jgi:hypothetical protein